MTRTRAAWLLVVAMIGVLLGGAALILERDAGPRSDVPSGFLH
jgi:hypothetical protein